MDVAAVGLMLAFEGFEPPGWVLDELRRPDVVGVTLFRERNVASASQLRTLTDRLRRVNPRLLVAVDQEGGQLIGAGSETTPFPGNLALGATGDVDLARRAGEVTGRELAALGVSVNYAPVCDVASRPGNPSLGTRSFGSDPTRVAAFAAAYVEGLQASGVAATLKHFPGKGFADVDPHHSLPVLRRDLDDLEAVEWPPFRAGIDAGAWLVMCGHYAVPALSGTAEVPISRVGDAIEAGIRVRLGFDRVVITDALDMGAVAAGVDPVSAAVETAAAGVDLLLFGPDREFYERTRRALAEAPITGPEGSRRRVGELVDWCGRSESPGLDVVGSSAHRDLADRIAHAAVTLVRDRTRLLPLRPVPDRSIAAVMPRPRALTPADTSHLETPRLASALRRHFPDVTELTVSHPPTGAEIDAVVAAVEGCSVVVVGTIAADRDPAQVELVRRLHRCDVDVVTVALSTPYDLAAYPEVDTHLCTYSLVAPALDALADVIAGTAPAKGRLPVPIPGLYPCGHGAEPR